MINWSEHTEQTKNRPPSEMLVKALSYVVERDTALDLGAGALNDSQFLAESGFKKVIALDKDDSAQLTYDQLPKEKIDYVISSFENYSFPKDSFDLITAQYSLPFSDPGSLDSIMKNLKQSLKIKGVFVGQFFGINDSWNHEGSKIHFHTIEEVKELVSDLKIIEFTEEEIDRKLASGTPKHWHLFHIIAQKI